MNETHQPGIEKNMDTDRVEHHKTVLDNLNSLPFICNEVILEASKIFVKQFEIKVVSVLKHLYINVEKLTIRIFKLRPSRLSCSIK